MANYDDIFNASAQEGTEDKSFVSFNKEEWAAQKKQERESAFAMIDETAQRMANDGGLFQSYLDVQARFDRYSVGNAVLITAQKRNLYGQIRCLLRQCHENPIFHSCSV